MKDIAIFGSGGFGREVQMLIEQINLNNNKWNFVGFFDDGIKPGTIINGKEVLGDLNAINNYNKHLNVVFSIGNPKVKQSCIEKVSNLNVTFPVLIHPKAIIGNNINISIGEGSIICGGNILTVNINLGKHIILNLSCTVGHDTRIGDYSSIMPGVNISGEVNIGNNVYISTGVKIINRVNIGDNSIIGAGAVVTKSLPSNCTAVGIPATPIKYQ